VEYFGHLSGKGKELEQRMQKALKEKTAAENS